MAQWPKLFPQRILDRGEIYLKIKWYKTFS